MLKFLFGVLLILHGLVHLLYVGQSMRRFELRPGMVWPDGSWALSPLLGVQAIRWLASAAFVLAALGFVASGLGVFLDQAWARHVISATALFSSLAILILWDGTLRKLADQGLIALLINAALVIAALVVRWPAVGP